MKSENKMPILKVLKSMLDLSSNIFKKYNVLVSYAFILSLVSLVFGRWSYSCQKGNDGFWCQYNLIKTAALFYGKIALYYVLNIFLLLSFMVDFYNTSFKNEAFSIRKIFSFSREKLKSVGGLFLLFLFVLAPIVASYFIIKKPANPNWIIEFGFFWMLVVMLITPLIAMRLSSGLGFYLQDNKIPDFKELYRCTSGHSMTPIMVFLMTLLFGVIISLQSGIHLSQWVAKHNVFTVVFVSEFLSYFIILIFYSVVTIMLRAQYEVLIAHGVSRETTATENNNNNKEVFEKPRKKSKKKTDDNKSEAKKATKKKSTSASKTSKTRQKVSKSRKGEKN